MAKTQIVIYKIVSFHKQNGLHLIHNTLLFLNIRFPQPCWKCNLFDYSENIVSSYKAPLTH